MNNAQNYVPFIDSISFQKRTEKHIGICNTRNFNENKRNFPITRWYLSSFLILDPIVRSKLQTTNSTLIEFRLVQKAVHTKLQQKRGYLNDASA